jgi:hypothetical protein
MESDRAAGGFPFWATTITPIPICFFRLPRTGKHRESYKENSFVSKGSIDVQCAWEGEIGHSIRERGEREE